MYEVFVGAKNKGDEAGKSLKGKQHHVTYYNFVVNLKIPGFIPELRKEGKDCVPEG